MRHLTHVRICQWIHEDICWKLCKVKPFNLITNKRSLLLMVTCLQCVIFALQQEKSAYVSSLCYRYVSFAVFTSWDRILIFISFKFFTRYLCIFTSFRMWDLILFVCVIFAYESFMNLLQTMLAIFHLYSVRKANICNWEAACIHRYSFLKHLVLCSCRCLGSFFVCLFSNGNIGQLHVKCETELKSGRNRVVVTFFFFFSPFFPFSFPLCCI